MIIKIWYCSQSKRVFWKVKNVIHEKHKGMRKGAAEMNLTSCASRILSLNDSENLHKQNPIKTHRNIFKLKMVLWKWRV